MSMNALSTTVVVYHIRSRDGRAGLGLLEASAEGLDLADAALVTRSAEGEGSPERAPAALPRSAKARWPGGGGVVGVAVRRDRGRRRGRRGRGAAWSPG